MTEQAPPSRHWAGTGGDRAGIGSDRAGTEPAPCFIAPDDLVAYLHWGRRKESAALPAMKLIMLQL